MIDRIKLSISTFLGILVIILAIGFFMLFIDQLLHQKFDKIAGLNYKGYRGEVRKEKRIDEYRIAMFGGSPLWGYGVYYWESIPYLLERKLQYYIDSLELEKKIVIFNLGYNNEGIFAVYNNMQDFMFLDYDAVIIFTGYDDLGIGNTTNVRQENLFFKHLKYMPILPVYLQEKILLLRSSGNLEEAYWGHNKMENSNPNIGANTLSNILSIYNSTQRVLDRIKHIRDSSLITIDIKNDKWAWFKYYLRKSIIYSIEKNKNIWIVTEPIFNEDCRGQQNVIRDVLYEFSDNHHVNFYDLGSDFKLNKEYLIDGVHFTKQGCMTIADSMFNHLYQYIMLKITTLNNTDTLQ